MNQVILRLQQDVLPPLSELSSSIDVRAHSESNGIDIYGQVVRFILAARHS